MGDLIRETTGQEFTFHLSFLFTTKGELCSSLQEPQLRSLIVLAISCDGFPQRVLGKPQCGLCPSCLLRRQSLYSAGLSEFDMNQGYRCDVFDKFGGVDSGRLYAFNAMCDQARVIRVCLAAENPWRALCSRYPELLRTAVELREQGHLPDRFAERMVSLYSRYCSEWEPFEAYIRDSQSGRAA